MTFQQWAECDNRDREPLILEKSFPRLYWDRFFRAFILPDADRVVGVEEIMDLLKR